MAALRVLFAERGRPHLVLRNGSGLTALLHNCFIACTASSDEFDSGRRLMLHLILATLVIVIATDVIAGIVIASTLLLLRKVRGS
jgi:hypothetical protein